MIDELSWLTVAVSGVCPTDWSCTSSPGRALLNVLVLDDWMVALEPEPTFKSAFCAGVAVSNPRLTPDSLMKNWPAWPGVVAVSARWYGS